MAVEFVTIPPAHYDLDLVIASLIERFDHPVFEKVTLIFRIDEGYVHP